MGGSWPAIGATGRPGLCGSEGNRGVRAGTAVRTPLAAEERGPRAGLPGEP